MISLIELNNLIVKYNITVSENEYSDMIKHKSEHISTQCPECLKTRSNNSGKPLEIYVHQNIFVCQHCGFTGSINHSHKSEKMISLNEKSFTTDIPKKIIEWFEKSNISKHTLEEFKIGYQRVYMPKTEDSTFCIMYPYYKNDKLVNIKFEDSKGNTRLINRADVSFFNVNNINGTDIYITESEIDVLALADCGVKSAIAMPLNANMLINDDFFINFDFLESIETHIQNAKKITLLFSTSETSQKIQEELARRMGKEKCYFIPSKEKLDGIAKYLQKNGKKETLALLDNARPYPIKGIFEMVDIEDKFDILYENGLPGGSSTGFSNVDEYYTVKEGQWTLVTGVPGHGKSNFLDGVLVNLADKLHWKIGVFSPENQPIERHLANILEKYIGLPFNYGIHERISPEAKEIGKKWLQERFYIILPDDEEEGNWSLDGILKLAKTLVFRKGIKGLVIDPWNEIDHSRPYNLTETEYISQSLTKIRRFARAYNVHVWVVAHPAKLAKDQTGKYPVPTPYDVSGSAHWRNKADNAISVWRNVGGPDDDIVDVHIQKIRFKEIGKVGLTSLRFDKVSGRFNNDIDQNKRSIAKEKGIDLPTEELLIKRNRK